MVAREALLKDMPSIVNARPPVEEWRELAKDRRSINPGNFILLCDYTLALEARLSRTYGRATDIEALARRILDRVDEEKA